jgi:hypothetical protein
MNHTEERAGRIKKKLERHVNDTYTQVKDKTSWNALSNWFQSGMGKQK